MAEFQGESRGAVCWSAVPRSVGVLTRVLVLCSLTLASACSDDGAPAGNEGRMNGGQTGVTLPDQDIVQDGAAGANAPTETGDQIQDDAAGPMQTPPVDDGTMDDGAMGDGAMDDATMDDGPMDADAAPAGPWALPPPEQVGPYEVTEDENVGVGFENAIASGDQGDGLGCLSFIMSFGQDAQASRDYAMIPDGHDMALYTLYRPTEIPEGVELPALSWANGTCAHPVGYADMFRHIVSHGFIIVAAHSRYTGSGAAQVRGLDYLVAANEDPESPLFGRVDTEALGIFGHSQGSSSTANASDDPRVRSVVFMHGGTANPDAPALFLTSDLEARGVLRGFESATGKAAYGKLENSDHITMMVEHERMAPEVTAWFRYTLLDDDQEAATWFVGNDCLLCSDAEWEYMAKGL